MKNITGSDIKVVRLITAQILLPESLGVVPLDTQQLKEDLLEQGRRVKAVTKPEDAEALSVVARDIRTWVKRVREAGKALRDPLRAKLDEIKRIEDDYCEALEEEQKRDERLAVEWKKAEDERVRKEEEARAREVQRLEDERIAAEEKAKEEKERAEREEREAQDRAKASEAAIQSEEDLQKAVEAEDKRKAEALARQVEAEKAAEEARRAAAASQAAIVAPLPAAKKVSGMATKRVVKWKVTDQDALFKERPHLFSVEVKPSAVNSTCFPKDAGATEERPDTSVPGLSMWWETVASTRKW